MTSLIHLEIKSREALLDSLATLAGFFWGPDSESCREIRQGSAIRPFKDLEILVKFKPPDLLSALDNIISSFAETEALFSHLEEGYVSLFINSRHGIIAPLYASCYVEGRASGEKGLLMGPPAIAMKKRLESSGLSLADNMNEPPDHLSIELEYLYFLLKKGWDDNDSELLTEAVFFAAKAMVPWVTLLRERIANDNSCRFYPLITSATVSILDYIGRQVASI